jgi:hypothetical protein
LSSQPRFQHGRLPQAAARKLRHCLARKHAPSNSYLFLFVFCLNRRSSGGKRVEQTKHFADWLNKSFPDTSAPSGIFTQPCRTMLLQSIRALSVRFVTLSASITQTTAPQPLYASRSTACTMGNVPLALTKATQSDAKIRREKMTNVQQSLPDRLKERLGFKARLPERFGHTEQFGRCGARNDKVLLAQCQQGA